VRVCLHDRCGKVHDPILYGQPPTLIVIDKFILYGVLDQRQSKMAHHITVLGTAGSQLPAP
jgi:hypothetical protein